MEGKAAFPQAIKRPYAGNRISRESGTSDTAEKRENENRRSGRNGVQTSSFFRRKSYSPTLLAIHEAWFGGPAPSPGAYPWRRQWFRNFWACTMASRIPRPSPK